MKGARTLTALAALCAGALAGMALVGSVIWFLGSDAAVRWATGEVIARTGGKLRLDDVGGSLGGTMHIGHLRYADDTFRFTADDIALTWSPRMLLQKTIAIQSLTAARVELQALSSGGSNSLPDSLALPWSIDVTHADIAAIDVVSGPNRWRVTQVGFSYAGGPTEHTIDDLTLDSDWGSSVGTSINKLQGKLTVAAAKPFATAGVVSFDGNETLKRVRTQVAISGDLAALTLTGDATALDAHASATVVLAPFAVLWFRGGQFTVANLDLARFNAALPRTALNGSIDHVVESNGRWQGQFALKNALPGSWSVRSLPIATLTAAWVAEYNGEHSNIALRGIDATFVNATNGAAATDAGRATGDARLDGDVMQWTLALRDFDLHGLATDLKPTRLAGTVAGKIDLGSRDLEGEASGRLEQAAMTLAFDAGVHAGTLTLRQFVAHAHGGTLQGSATIALNETRAFTVAASATALDPAAFGDYPAASLSGTFAAHGLLEPEWSAALTFRLAPSSRWRDLPVTGEGALALAPTRVHDAKLDVSVGTNHLQLNGAFGAALDRMNFVLDAANLAAIDALATGVRSETDDHADGRSAPHFGGQLRASGHIDGSLQHPSAVFTAGGTALYFGTAFAATTVVASGTIAAGSGTTTTATKTTTTKAVDDANLAWAKMAERRFQLEVAATGLRLDNIALATASVNISGTVAHQTLSINAAGGDAASRFDIAAHGEGGWSGTLSGGSWIGKIVALDGRGAYPFALDQTAQLEAGRTRVELTGARGTFSGGRFAVDELRWEQGRVSSRGMFTGLPAAPLLALTAVKDKLNSTLTLGGHWEIAATPRLNGTLVINREGGDVAPRDSPQLLLGLTQTDLTAEFVDDRVHASFTGRSRYADASVVADLASTTVPGGRFADNAPLQLTAHLDTASLRELQALAGTTALIDGQLKLDLVGHGTLQHVRFTGTVDGENLKAEAPQYGTYLKNGRLRATLTDQTLTVDELSFNAGDGRFVASGSVPAIANGELTGASLTWKAEQLALFNRPDQRLTLTGEGTLALKDKTVTLAGAIKADAGYFEFQPSQAVTLGSDVVVRGRTAPTGTSRLATQRIPFAVDLTLDFGNNLRFVGEGFDTGLAGKITVQTTPDHQLVANGTISAVRGTYTAFGQRLAIQRGQIYFNGLFDNPGLDVFALRKGLAVEAGVEVTGSVRLPNVRLTSNPPVPDNEKLAWLVLGHGLDNSNSADTAALAAALSALGGVNATPFGQRVANTFGIDDISFRSVDKPATANGASTTSSQVIAFTKQLTGRLSLVYEQGLSVANNAVKIEYALSRTVTIRAEAGVVSGIGIYYSRSLK